LLIYMQGRFAMGPRLVVGFLAFGLIASSARGAYATESDLESDSTSVSDVDLMYSAVRQWRGASPDEARIDRVLAKSKRESDHKRRILNKRLASLVWRDPFSDDPDRPIPVRREDREMLAARMDRMDGIEMSPENAAAMLARAEAALARARALRAKAEAVRAQAFAARAEARAAARACVDPAAFAGRAGKPSRAARSARAMVDHAPPASSAAIPATTTPAAARSADPRGIIVVPIESPVPIRSERSARAIR
jgi:hypothetical protein